MTKSLTAWFLITGLFLSANAPVFAAGPEPGKFPGLPVNLGGPFLLTDQHGNERSEADPQGRLQMLFFGYANCQQICSVAMPLMGEVTDRLAKRNIDTVPVMITVDPERDTVENMGPALASYHQDFVGLTGDLNALEIAYEAYEVEYQEHYVDDVFGAVLSHNSFIYLLNAQGEFLTAIPPILSARRTADIVASYQGVTH